MAKPPLSTIGYEGRTVAEFMEALEAARVELVIDVRAVAASRRLGFSKTVLAAGLRDRGIDYLHLRSLGTPKAGREAARKGRSEEHTSELQSLMRISYAVFCLKKKKT